MVSKEFFAALDELCASKGMDKQAFIETFQSALSSAYKKHAGDASNVIVKLNEEKCSIRFFATKTVVSEVVDFDKEISLEDAKEYKKSLKVGDTYEKEFTPKDFGRIAAGTAKQVIMQRVRMAERDSTMQEFEDKENEIQSAIVRRIENGNV